MTATHELHTAIAAFESALRNYRDDLDSPGVRALLREHRRRIDTLKGGIIMDTQRNAMDEAELIAQVNRDFGTNHEDLLTALDEFYLNGCADEQSGNVEAPTGHFFRVHRWIVTTDNYGFKSLNECDTESDAINDFRAAEEEYAAWDAEED